jgi:hypothetical protein
MGALMNLLSNVNLQLCIATRWVWNRAPKASTQTLCTTMNRTSGGSWGWRARTTQTQSHKQHLPCHCMLRQKPANLDRNIFCGGI